MKARSTLVLSIDQGTTGSRAFVFDSSGRVVSRAYREIRQYYPRPGWVEHDPEDLFKSVMQVVTRAAGTGQRGLWKRIGAIGITNQRETFVLWDARSGRPIHRAIVWQCRRSAGLCERMKEAGHEGIIRRRTGLVVDPYFSGTKVRWLLDYNPGVRSRVLRGEACFGTIDSWLLWRLTRGIHATDYTNASRTMLFDIRSRRWSSTLLDILGIPSKLRLPDVRPSAGDFGRTDVSGIPGGIPISGICGDQQAALFGQGAVTAGEIKNTYGTGCFLMIHTGDRIHSPGKGLLATMACRSDGGCAYALEGAVFIAGAAIQWLRDGLGILSSAAESESLARSVPDSGGVTVVPAFVGLGAPYWNPSARGAIFGITRGTTRAHVVRAALDAIALQTMDVFEIMRAACARHHPPISIRRLRVDGGAAKNDLLLQIQSDLLGIPVIRPRQTETTAWGAARLAGIGAGLWPARSVRSEGDFAATVFRPSLGRSESRVRIETWRALVQRLL